MPQHWISGGNIPGPLKRNAHNWPASWPSLCHLPCLSQPRQAVQILPLPRRKGCTAFWIDRYQLVAPRPLSSRCNSTFLSFTWMTIWKHSSTVSPSRQNTVSSHSLEISVNPCLIFTGWKDFLNLWENVVIRVISDSRTWCSCVASRTFHRYEFLRTGFHYQSAGAGLI